MGGERIICVLKVFCRVCAILEPANIFTLVWGKSAKYWSKNSCRTSTRLGAGLLWRGASKFVRQSFCFQIFLFSICILYYILLHTHTTDIQTLQWKLFSSETSNLPTIWYLTPPPPPPLHSSSSSSSSFPNLSEQVAQGRTVWPKSGALKRGPELARPTSPSPTSRNISIPPLITSPLSPLANEHSSIYYSHSPLSIIHLLKVWYGLNFVREDS